MSSKLDIYYDKQSLQEAASGLLKFGAEVFKRAKCIRELERFSQLFEDLEARRLSHNDSEFHEFIFEWLIDTVRIAVFFEAYFKSKLILGGFCIHQISGNEEFKKLKRELAKRPVSMPEVHKYSAFVVEAEMKSVKCKALNANFTIGLSTLLKEPYLEFYQMETDITDFLNEIKDERNRLHFHDKIELKLSEKLMKNLLKVNQFVETVVEPMRQ